MAITLLASACPAPQPAGSAFYHVTDRVDAAALRSFDKMDTGAQFGLAASRLNANASRTEQMCRYGCGGRAVVSGLGFVSSSGLDVTVAAGIAMADGPEELAVNTPIVSLPDNTAHVYIWLKAGGVLTFGTTTAVPAGGKVFLFSVTTSGGVVTAHDESGVVTLNSNQLWRQTADNGAPTDTPDSSLRIFTLTKGGEYLWDGTQHVAIGNTGRQAVNVGAANQTLTLAQMMAQVIEATGAPGSAKQIIWPQAVDGRAYDVYNSTGQIVTFKVSGQTGVDVGAGKAARLYCHATDIRRLTSDVTP